jgi:hypothetical protein
MKKIFDGFDPEQYADEAEQRWGDAEAYKVSTQRAKSYTDADWQKIKDQQAAIYADAFAALTAGARGGSALRREHRQAWAGAHEVPGGRGACQLGAQSRVTPRALTGLPSNA